MVATSCIENFWTINGDVSDCVLFSSLTLSTFSQSAQIILREELTSTLPLLKWKQLCSLTRQILLCCLMCRDWNLHCRAVLTHRSYSSEFPSIPAAHLTKPLCRDQNFDLYMEISRWIHVRSIWERWILLINPIKPAEQHGMLPSETVSSTYQKTGLVAALRDMEQRRPKPQ